MSDADDARGEKLSDEEIRDEEIRDEDVRGENEKAGGESPRSVESSVEVVESEEVLVRRRSRRLVPVVVSVVAIVALVVVAWLLLRGGGEKSEEETVVEVEVAPSARTEVREYVEATGTLNALPGHEASFSAATAGKVTRVLVQVGQRVAAGQTLAELDRSVLAAQVRQAEAAVAQAAATAAQAARTASNAQTETVATDQIRQAESALAQARANQTQAQNNLTRAQTLFDRGIAARKEVEEAQTQAAVANAAVAQAQSALAAARVNAARGVGEARTQANVTAGGVEAARAALAMARAQLALAAIRSPINGTVTRRSVNDGETVDPATPAFEVVDASSLDLVANLPAEYLERVREGNLAVVRAEPFPDKEFAGGVVQVAPAVDPQTNTVAVRVRLPNPDGELKAGIFATARVAVEIHTDALVVPETALVVEGDETFVFVVRRGEKEESTVEKRKVEVGIRDGGRAEIVDGLNTDDVVVTTGAFGLSDGAKIKIVENANADEKNADEKGAKGKDAGADEGDKTKSAGESNGGRDEK